ncbi:hypothetical protein NE586_05920 [Gemmiger formicilis]|uniref:hypothetical protein n=1 Tax=Gemmiger formicilis TaxID=745368 RepID=UPI00210CCF83|nr:hypothetical protein [Gemmiger formicilis]MCI6786375.1 hypothetical protein [Oscillospiraceae bacterium]MCQ5079439.1 hypothetical protein [Gemmiger formicilis]MCQ5116030.1 hypothetical protein [Gemmiger formicilis]
MNETNDKVKTERPTAPKELTDRCMVSTPIGPVCMSRVEYEMYREELERRKALSRQ